MTKLLTHVKRNAVAYLALFVALGGTSYAAFRLPAGSVGTRALHNGAVTNKKLAKGAVGAADLDKKTLGGYVRAFAVVHGDKVFNSQPRAQLINWHTDGIAPGGFIEWRSAFPSTCLAVATTANGMPTPSYADADLVRTGGRSAKEVQVVVSTNEPQTVTIAVVCPSR